MKKYFSYTTFICVSVVIVYSGYFSLKLGFEKGSNFKQLSGLYKQRPTATLGSHSEIPNNGNPHCLGSESAMLLETNSIVDFLYYQKKDSSFTYRSVLAQKNNIPDYIGSPYQNMLLLAILKQELTICEDGS